MRQAAARLTHLLLILALVTGAFGMTPVLAGKAQQTDLSDYTLPDGSLPLLCLPAGGGADEDGAGLIGHCPYCRTAADVTLPALFAQPQNRVLPQTQRLPRGTSLPARQVLRPSAPLRGPPAERS